MLLVSCFLFRSFFKQCELAAPSYMRYRPKGRPRQYRGCKRGEGPILEAKLQSNLRRPAASFHFNPAFISLCYTFLAFAARFLPAAWFLSTSDVLQRAFIEAFCWLLIVFLFLSPFFSCEFLWNNLRAASKGECPAAMPILGCLRVDVEGETILGCFWIYWHKWIVLFLLKMSLQLKKKKVFIFCLFLPQYFCAVFLYTIRQSVTNMKRMHLLFWTVLGRA